MNKDESTEDDGKTDDEIVGFGAGYDSKSDSLRDETIMGPMILGFMDDLSNIFGQILSQNRRDGDKYTVEIRGKKYNVSSDAWTAQDVWAAIVQWKDKNNIQPGTFKQREYFCSEGKGASVEKMFELQIVASIRQNILIRDDYEFDGDICLSGGWVFDPVWVLCQSIGDIIKRLNRIYAASGKDFKSLQGRGNNKIMYMMADEVISAMDRIRRSAAEWHGGGKALEYADIFNDLSLAHHIFHWPI